MAGMWRNAMSYLGLGPDEDYDDFEPEREAADGDRLLSGPPPSAQPARPRAANEDERAAAPRGEEDGSRQASGCSQVGRA